MPQLYIIRHGLAGEHGSYADDTQRPLTEEGVQKTRKVAKRLHQLELRFDLMLTSPYIRARQTAEILQAQGLCDRLEETPFLAQGGNFQAWLQWFDQWRASSDTVLALVGHEPDLSEWAETLIWGKPIGHLELKKAGVIGLTLPASGSPVGASTLFWLTPPRLLL